MYSSVMGFVVVLGNVSLPMYCYEVVFVHVPVLCAGWWGAKGLVPT